MDKGYVQVYTGNGKGKTTCMLGMTLRACGAGKRIYIGQFIKNDNYSEIKAIRQYLPQVTVEQYGNGRCLIRKGEGSPEDIESARKGCERALSVLASRQNDIVILDEINVAVFLELLNESDLLALIESRPPETELILTGRYAAQAVVDKADLVTEMTEIKHYYQQGVTAHMGIEK